MYKNTPALEQGSDNLAGAWSRQGNDMVRRSVRNYQKMQAVRSAIYQNMMNNASNDTSHIDRDALEVYRQNDIRQLIYDNWTRFGEQYDMGNDNHIQKLSQLYNNKNGIGTLYKDRYSRSARKIQNVQMLTSALSRFTRRNTPITFNKIHKHDRRKRTLSLCDELVHPNGDVLVILALSPFHATLLFILFNNTGIATFYSVGFGYNDDGSGADKIPVNTDNPDIQPVINHVNESLRCKVGSIYSPDYLTPDATEKFKPVWVGKYTADMRDKLQHQLSTVTSVHQNSGNTMLNVTTPYSEAGASILAYLPESVSWCVGNVFGVNADVQNCLIWAQKIIGEHGICAGGNPSWDCGGDITNEDWEEFINNINDQSISILNEKLKRKKSYFGGRNKRKQRKTYKKKKKTKRKKRKNKKTKKMY